MNFLKQQISKSVQAKLDFLMDSADWSLSKLQELQWEKFEKLIRHSYDTCPFYRNRMDQLKLHPKRDFNDLGCISKLPILEKTDIQQHLQQLVTSDPAIQGVELNSTGGSTGQPLEFYQDENYRTWAAATRLRAWRRHPELDIPDNAYEAVLWGAIRDVGKGLRFKSVLRNLYYFKSLRLNTFDLDEASLRKFLRIYNWLRPPILRGYASALYYAANFVVARNIKIHLHKVIISSSDILKPFVRERIEQVFKAEIIDSYGSREVSQIATECLAHTGLHLVMETQWVELIGNDIIVTNLDNFGMPFLRYRIGDLATTLDKSICPCGLETPRLVGLLGRDTDTIELPNGKTINGHYFEHIFYGFKSVENFQVVYSRDQRQLRVRLKVSKRGDGVDEMIREKMKEYFDITDVRVEFTERFEMTPTGKLRFVYSVDSFDTGDDAQSTVSGSASP